MIVLEYILLVGVIVCAIAAPLCKRLLASVWRCCGACSRARIWPLRRRLWAPV